MLTKKRRIIITLLFGFCLAGFGLLLRGEDIKNIAGICIGIGAGLFGMSISDLIMNNMEEKNPELAKQNAIELKDERNTMIRNRAKAKAEDITHWLTLAIAYVSILLNGPLWVVLLVVLVFVLYHIMGLYFMGKYQKVM